MAGRPVAVDAAAPGMGGKPESAVPGSRAPELIASPNKRCWLSRSLKCPAETRPQGFEAVFYHESSKRKDLGALSCPLSLPGEGGKGT